jgi:hypothetical protein
VWALFAPVLLDPSPATQSQQTPFSNKKEAEASFRAIR